MHWLIIKLSELNTESPSYCFLDKKDTSKQLITTDWEQLASLKYKKCIVLIPSTEVTLNSIKLPTKSYSQLKKAIPYALENELADDVSTLHFSFYRSDNKANSTTHTATINRSRLEAWLYFLTEHNIKPQYLLPDLFSLPVTEQGYSLVINDDHATIRENNLSGFACNMSMLPMLINDSENKETLTCSQQDHPSLEEITLQREYYSVEFSTTCHADLIKALPLNLLQGLNNSDDKNFEKIPYLKSIATLALFCIALWTGQTIVKNQSLSHEIEQLHSEINTLFSDTLPNRPIDSDYRILNAQMEEALKSYSTDSQGKQASALQLLHSIAPKLASDKSLKLKKINYDSLGLLLTIQAQSISTIDNLLQNLPPKISAQRTSSNSSANQVQATILIKAKKS